MALLASLLLSVALCQETGNNPPPQEAPADSYEQQLNRIQQQFANATDPAVRRQLLDQMDALDEGGLGMHSLEGDGTGSMTYAAHVAMLRDEAGRTKDPEMRERLLAKVDYLRLQARGLSAPSGVDRAPAGDYPREQLRGDSPLVPPVAAATPQPTERLEQLHERFPADPMPPALLGSSYFQQGRFPQAEEALTDAVDNGAKNADVYYLRGAAALNQGKFEPAAKDLKKALEMQPDHPQAHDLLKLAEKRIVPVEMKERPQAAVHAMGSVAPHKIPMGKDAFERSTRMTKEAEGRIKVRDYDGALSALKGAIEANPEDAKARFLRTEILLKKGKNSEAEEEATRLLEILPDHAGGFNMRALARNRQKKFALALQDAEAAARIKPDSAIAHYNRAYALAGLGRRQEALDALAQAAGLDPVYAPALARLRDLPADADPLLVFEDAEQSPDAPPAPRRKAHPALPLAGAAAALLGLGAFLWRRRRPAGGNYQLGDELGRGKLGVVYRAMDLALQRPVAVRVLKDGARKEGLLREARLLAALRHPNIVAVHDAVVQGGDLLVVLELAAGRPLSETLKDFHHLSWEDSKDIVRQAANALDYAHSRRIVHGDLKPANLMVGPDGKVSVMDFCLARRAEPGEDVRALGACLCEMLTGEPGRVPSSPPGLEAVLRRALHPQPESRYHSAGEFALAVEGLGKA